MPFRPTTAATGLGILLVGAMAVVPTAGPVSAEGSTVYVNKYSSACSDAAVNAGSAAQPYCTLQTAVDAARPGDTVQVAAGDYPPLEIKNSGTASAPITIQGPAPTFPKGSPSVALYPAAGGAGPALLFDQVHDVVVANVDTSANAGTVVGVVASSHVTMRQDFVRSLSAAGPAVAVDGRSSGFTLSQSQLSSFGSSATAVSVASGATGTVLTTNVVKFQGQGAVVADAPRTVLVSNTFLSSPSMNAIALTGASTGAIVENNVVSQGGGRGFSSSGGASCSICVSDGSLPGIHEDYNTIETTSTGPLYDWAGQTYSSSTALHTATGQAGHDDSLVETADTTSAEMYGKYVDAADQNAPDELSKDVGGQPRVDDPLIADTGTGVGYYDRGAMEVQDPYRVAPVLSVRKGPAPFTEKVTAQEDNPWHTAISGYRFDFGDGSAPVESATPSASHTYTARGEYTVTVTATAADGSTTTHSGTATVVAGADAPLLPQLSIGHQPGRSSLSVDLGGQGSTDGWSIADYTFDFGDGTAPMTVPWNRLGEHVYAKPGAYTVTMTVRDDGGRTARTSRRFYAGSVLVPVSPVRILDTRSGKGAPKAKLGPGGVLRLKVTGTNGIPAAGVTAVTLNLTGLDATAATWVGGYPDGTARPSASDLDVQPGRTAANQVTVPVGADGYVDLYNHSGSVDLVGDVQGYYSDATSTGGYVQPYGPERVMDTRSGTGTVKQKVPAGGYVSFQLPYGLQTGVSAVVLNLTATGGTASSYISVLPAGGGAPNTSVLNTTAGQTVSNQVVAPVDSDGAVTFYNHSGTVDLVADLQGLVLRDDLRADDTSPGSPYFPLTPTRVLDTRDGTGAVQGPLGAGSKLALKVAGVDGVPADAKAVLVNLTGISPTTATWIAAYPDGSAVPTSSNLNLSAGQVQPVLALVPIGADGSIALYNHVGHVDVAVDIEGYYAGD